MVVYAVSLEKEDGDFVALKLFNTEYLAKIYLDGLEFDTPDKFSIEKFEIIGTEGDEL